MTEYKIKRAYAAIEEADGLRILVDRLWPRGIKKEALHAEWFREVAPSPELRKEWGHDPARFDWFKHAYIAELEARDPVLWQRWDELIGEAPVVTLVYAAKDEHVNHALVLRDWLLSR